MDRQHFLSLLYVAGIAPLVFALAQYTSPAHTWLVFGLINIVVLMILALIFSKLAPQKKAIGLAIIGGVGLFVLLIQGLFGLGTSLSQWFYNSFLSPVPVVNETTTDTLENIQPTVEPTLEPSVESLLSGEITPTFEQTLSGDTTPTYVAPTVSATTGTQVDTFDVQPVETTTPTVSSDSTIEPKYSTVLPAQGALTYAQVISYLVDHHKLKKVGSRTFNFTNIASSNVLYTPFAIAASHAMIGTDINPSTKVSCNTYMVLKGIAQGWKVTYTGAPQPAYRAKAVELGAVNGCADGAFVTKATL